MVDINANNDLNANHRQSREAELEILRQIQLESETCHWIGDQIDSLNVVDLRPKKMRLIEFKGEREQTKANFESSFSSYLEMKRTLTLEIALYIQNRPEKIHLMPCIIEIVFLIEILDRPYPHSRSIIGN